MNTSEYTRIPYSLYIAVLGAIMMIAGCRGGGVTLRPAGKITDTSWQAVGPIGVANGYAYIPTGRSGVRVISIGDPTRPIDLASLDMPGLGESVKVVIADQHMYVANTHNLAIYDIASDPQRPSFEAAWSEYEVWDIDVANDIAYVIARSFLHALDVSTPQEPKLLGSISVRGLDRNAIDASGDIVFVTARSELILIDASSPRELQQISEVELPLPELEEVSNLAASSRYVYVVSDSVLFEIDFSEPREPLLVAAFEIPRATPGYLPSSTYGYASPQIAVSNNYVFIGSGSELVVIDTSNPQQLAQAGSFTLPGLIQGISVSPDTLYVAGEGLTILSLK